MLCCSQWEFRLKALRCSPTDLGGTFQVVGQGHTSSSSPPWWQSILPVGFSWLVCRVYLIKVQPLQLFSNSRHVFILISACCQQVFPQKYPYRTIPSSAIICRHLLLCSEVESNGQKVLREQPCKYINSNFSLKCCLCLIILHRKCWCSPPSNHPCFVLLLIKSAVFSLNLKEFFSSHGAGAAKCPCLGRGWGWRISLLDVETNALIKFTAWVTTFPLDSWEIVVYV